MNAVPDKAAIEEVALELGIDPAFVEKDWYVVQIIKEITSMESLGAQAIFAGGTALSKAHRLLQRFSEDIDFRLILPQDAAATKSRQRKLLSAIRDRLHGMITTHFPLEAVKWKSRDDNRYFAFEIDYSTAFGSSNALRPHLQVEFTRHMKHRGIGDRDTEFQVRHPITFAKYKRIVPNNSNRAARARR